MKTVSVGLCWLLLLLITGNQAVLVESLSPTADAWEDTVYQAAQDVVAPVGRPDFQARALAKFAAGLAADPFGVLPLWTGESHPCGDASGSPWPGVTCDAPQGSITGIKLAGKALKGPLPDSFGLLKSLRSLDLSNNSFFGSLPSSWSNLSLLETCDLSSNKLTGSLPPTFSSWSAMQSLNLRRNSLTGPLPATWASMNMLQVLDLSHNQLTSSLPPSWAQLGYLSVLNLAQNNLEGTLPPAWAQQRLLLQLNIGGNRIEGVLPPQWAEGMDSLRGVNATGNSLKGSLPYEWSNMTSLQVLSVDKNQLTGSIPPSWSTLNNLYAVNVTSNEGLCGFVPDGVAGVLDLNTTSLNTHCPWTDDANRLLSFKASLYDPLQSMGNWKQGGNPCGPQPWSGLVCNSGWVVAIRLSDRGLAGPLTPDLAQMSRLAELHLNNNWLSGTLPSGWSAAPDTLATIDLSNNTLSGSLPKVWSNLTSLSYLDLSFNELVGELPLEWGRLTNLTTLLLSSNRGLNGTLPAAWSSLSNLQTVHLDDGNFTGQLPASWSKMSQLREMSLSSNALTGTVPARLAALSFLDLSRNQLLCGSPPSTAANATLRTQRTSLGQDCSALVAARLSGIRGVILGACIGVVGSAILAGSAFLVMRRRLQGLQGKRPQQASVSSRPGSGKASPVPSYHSSIASPSRGFHTVGSPVPAGVARSATSSPAMVTPMSPSAAASPTRTTSPQLLPLPPHRLAFGRQGSSPVAASILPSLRPMSPLSIPISAPADDAESNRPADLRRHNSSISQSDEPVLAVHSVPSSPVGSQLALARSLSISGVVVAAVHVPSTTADQGSKEEAVALPGCPRTVEFDGLPSPNRPRPASPAGLKLHVATVLKATAAAAAPKASAGGLSIQLQAAEASEGAGVGGDGSSTAASPRGEADLGGGAGVIAAVAASAAMVEGGSGVV